MSLQINMPRIVSYATSRKNFCGFKVIEVWGLYANNMTRILIFGAVNNAEKAVISFCLSLSQNWKALSHAEDNKSLHSEIQMGKNLTTGLKLKRVNLMLEILILLCW